MLMKLHKLAWTYNPTMDACIFVGMHQCLASAIGILVVNVVLLLTMLIGLLRHAQRNSGGIWELLYQQVTLRTFSLSCAGHQERGTCLLYPF